METDCKVMGRREGDGNEQLDLGSSRGKGNESEVILETSILGTENEINQEGNTLKCAILR